MQGWPAGETFRYVFDELFFTHPGWIAAHNVLQAPLLLFPFDWHVRFQSPVSYWDPARHADIVRPLELALVVALAAYLLWPTVRRLSRRALPGPVEPDAPRADDSDTTA